MKDFREIVLKYGKLSHGYYGVDRDELEKDFGITLSHSSICYDCIRSSDVYEPCPVADKLWSLFDGRDVLTCKWYQKKEY